MSAHVVASHLFPGVRGARALGLEESTRGPHGASCGVPPGGRGRPATPCPLAVAGWAAPLYGPDPAFEGPPCGVGPPSQRGA
eukprot:8013838-Alexandrium_andersonii.AAC.1